MYTMEWLCKYLHKSHYWPKQQI